MMIEIMGTILFYLSLNVQLGSLDTIIFLLFLGCVLLSFIMNIYISHQIIKRFILNMEIGSLFSMF